MEENMLYLTGLCPYCSVALDYREDAKAVKCHCCGATVPTAKLELANVGSASNEESDVERRIAEGVVSAEAALAYASNLFEEYDWASFAETAKLSIPLVDAIAENCKVKFSTDPVTYILDFRRIAVPILKKIEGLEVLEVEIVNNYKSDDISDLFEYFDTYSSITHAIVNSREALYKELVTDIRLADKFGADKLIINDLERSLEVFEAEVNKVCAVNDITEIESYNQAKLAKDAKLSEKLREGGIDAEKTYEKAIALLEGDDVDNALHLFHAVRGFRDSTEIIKKHSSAFTFNDELVEMAGRRYLMVSRVIGDFDVKDPMGYTGEAIGTLHEIKGGVPEGAPALSQISKIIGSYGSRIFFVRNNEKICCFDTKSEELYANVREIDSANRGDYVIDALHPIRFSSDRSKFFVCKKLRDELKRGCFGRKKKVENGISRQNNYSIVLINMDNVTARTVLPGIVDVMDYFDNKIFYTTIAEGGGKETFRICNIDDGTNDSILDEKCLIHTVCDGKIIYSVCAPSLYNMDIYSIDIATKEIKLIDTNIRSFYGTHSGRVFYTVGNDGFNRLYSAEYDGANRQEIMDNPGRILTKKLRSGWIYYISGEGRNACLMKVSTDGERHVCVASRFDRRIKMTNGYIYYVNTNDELHVVRCDGHGDRKIADSVAKEKIIIDETNVYYFKYEYVGELDGDENGCSYSLYSTDLEGKNLRKLAFGVVSMKEYDEKTIYICKKRMATYDIIRPINAKKSVTEEVTKEITTYCSLDKASGKIETFLTLGVPVSGLVTVKGGCFGLFKKTRNVTVIERPRPIPYVRSGVSKMGDVLGEEKAEIQAKRDAKIAAKQAKRDEKQEYKEAKNNLVSNKARAKAEERARKRIAKEGLVADYTEE